MDIASRAIVSKNRHSLSTSDLYLELGNSMDTFKTSKVDSNINPRSGGSTMSNRKNTIDEKEQLQKGILVEV